MTFASIDHGGDDHRLLLCAQVNRREHRSPWIKRAGFRVLLMIGHVEAATGSFAPRLYCDNRKGGCNSDRKVLLGMPHPAKLNN